MEKRVERILEDFAHNIEKLNKRGTITTEHLETTRRNKMNETHSLILSSLYDSVLRATEEQYVIALNHGLKVEGKRKFTPDITVWEADMSRLLGSIDYESTNSSDSRIIHRNLRNYKNYVSNAISSKRPEFWLMITTLPSKQVDKSSWHSWDFIRHEILENDYVKVLENPFNYYFPKYKDEFMRLDKEREKCPLNIANLNASELRLCLPDNTAFVHTFSTK